MAKNIYGTTELWSYLQETKKPIVLYGMGNGADKIISVLNKKGLDFSDVFASDDFVRDKLFHGKKILHLSDIEKKYDDFIILVCFGSSLPDVMNRIKEISKRHELYAPDVPVAGEELFDGEFFIKNKEKIEKARSLLSDERSREIYDEIIRYKLDGNISHFQNTDSDSPLFSEYLSGGYGAYIDLGAFNGDTIEEALSTFPDIKKAVAFEPSERVFRKLSENTKKYKNIDLTLINACASNRDGISGFSDGGGRNSLITDNTEGKKTASGAKLKEIKLQKVDDAAGLSGEALLIKFDVEGAEKEAIEGARKTIVSNMTELCVSLYHRSEDIFSLPILINEILPYHKLFIRKTPYIPAWEINLYAVINNIPRNSR